MVPALPAAHPLVCSLRTLYHLVRLKKRGGFCRWLAGRKWIGLGLSSWYLWLWWWDTWSTFSCKLWAQWSGWSARGKAPSSGPWYWTASQLAWTWSDRCRGRSTRRREGAKSRASRLVVPVKSIWLHHHWSPLRGHGPIRWLIFESGERIWRSLRFRGPSSPEAESKTRRPITDWVGRC